MKKKLLLCSALSIIFSTHSFAFESYKAKLISHKEWTTGNVLATFKEKSTTMAFIDSRKQKQSTMENRISASLEYKKGTTGSLTTIEGGNSVSLSNNSSATKQYGYYFVTCADIDKPNSQCAAYEEHVDVEPGGYFTDTTTPVLQIQFEHPGTYPIRTYAMLFVSNQLPNQVQTNAESTVDITNP